MRRRNTELLSESSRRLSYKPPCRLVIAVYSISYLSCRCFSSDVIGRNRKTNVLCPPPKDWKLCLSLAFRIQQGINRVRCMQRALCANKSLERKLPKIHTSEITCSPLWDYITVFPVCFAVHKETLIQISCPWTFSHQEHTQTDGSHIWDHFFVIGYNLVYACELYSRRRGQ